MSKASLVCGLPTHFVILTVELCEHHYLGKQLGK